MPKWFQTHRFSCGCALTVHMPHQIVSVRGTGEVYDFSLVAEGCGAWETLLMAHEHVCPRGEHEHSGDDPITVEPI